MSDGAIGSAVGPCVLIIDDDDAFGVNASKQLESAGFRARFHRGPFGTLQALQKFSCDVVLLDISMPKLDGSLMARMIRDTFGHSVKILLCSNMEPAVLTRIARRLDADGSVPKTLFEEGNMDEIVATLRGRPTTGTNAVKPLTRGA